MASVASTYARAFADVVLSAHLDASRAVGGLQEIARLLGVSRGTVSATGSRALAALARELRGDTHE